MIRTNDSSRQILRAAALCLAGIGFTLLSGCGHGELAGPTGSTIASVRGTVHGGQSAVQGATIKLYHTNPAATTYGAAGIFIGSAVTDGNGAFNIASPTFAGTGSSANSTNCPAGAQAYITAAGGYAPGQPTQTNGNLLMMAALGDCSTVSASTDVIINEVTTVAAAYALSGFMTTALDGSNNYYAARVSAPVANSSGIGSITPTAPAGLAHAFMNAAKLVNVAQGMPNTIVSASTGGTTTYGSVPYTEILTLADIMQPCINSVSGSNGGVVAVPVSSGGSGYGASVSISGGSGSGATGNALVSLIGGSGLVTGLQLTAGGTGYSPTVTVTNGLGSGAVFVPSLANGVVSSVVIETGGTGYTPTVTISPPPSGTTATATSTLSNGTVNSINIVNAGSGYSSSAPPTVTIQSPISGVTAIGKVNVTSTGVVSGASVTTAGSGYGTLTVSSPTSGTTATLNYLATAGVIYNVSVSGGGTGYGPNVTITGAGAGSGAAATANVSGGAVTSLSVTNNGSGYPVPTVTIAPPAVGTAATATANVVGGSVASLSLVAGGSGYTAAPSVAISAPASGTTATATAAIPADSSTANIAASSSCSQLFALTPSLAGNYANNSLQAFINLARNPYPSSAAVGFAGLLSLVPSTAAFQPALASEPNDWALSIAYGTSSTSAATGTALPVPFWLTLDANDTAYLSTNFATTATQPVLYGIGSYGVAVPVFGAALTNATGRGIGADALGNIWYANNSTTSFNYIYQFSASAGGTPTAYPTFNYPFALVVDASNNVWVGHDIAGQPNFDEFAYTPASGSTPASWAQNYTATLPGGVNGLGVDASQNIWSASGITSGASGVSTEASVVANTGTPAAPAYNASGTTVSAVTTVFAGGAKVPYGVTFDASGNAWYDLNGLSSSVTAGIEEVTPNSTTALTSLNAGTFLTGSDAGSNGLPLNTVSSNLPAIDGAGTLFIPDSSTNAGGLRMYSTITSNTLTPFSGIKSCLLTSSTSTACGTSSSAAVYSPHQVAVDSTGSVWATNNSGGVTQILGIAAPSYPLQSIGKPGLSPGLVAVGALP